MDPLSWKARYAQQARWTAQLQAFLFDRARISKAKFVLEVGCGPGVITSQLHQQTSAQVHGLDLDLFSLKSASQDDPQSCYTCGDAQALPYASESLDLIYCHFLLLWLPNPLDALLEMKRVVKPGQPVLALAEPDYGGRIDYPPEMERLGHLQTQSLSAQGADTKMGRKLSKLFHEAGFIGIQSGVLGGEWSTPSPQVDRQLERAVLQADLSGMLTQAEINQLEAVEDLALVKGERVLFIPTFYAWGLKA